MAAKTINSLKSGLVTTGYRASSENKCIVDR